MTFFVSGISSTVLVTLGLPLVSYNKDYMYIFIIFGYNSISVGPRSNAKPHAKYAEMGLVNEQTTANTYTPLTLPGRLDKVEYVHLHKPV